MTKQTGQINSGTILLGFFAVMVGLGGTYAVRTAMTDPPAVVAPPPPPPPKPERIAIPLASRDILPGMEINLDDIALYRMTQEEIDKSIDAKTFMTNPKQIIGKIALTEIKRGKTFDTKDLLPTGKVPGVAHRIQPGTRAVTVSMKSCNALVGFASPGQRVDVLFHYGDLDSVTTGASANRKGGFYPDHHLFNPPRARDYYGNTIGGGGGGAGDLSDTLLQAATTTLVQDAQILALGTRSETSELATPLTEDDIRVTLAVTPRQAEMLRVATGHGELSLTLRSPDDDQQVALADPVTLNQIIDVDHTVHEMEIFRGQSRSKVQFGSDRSIRTRDFSGPPPSSSADPRSTALSAPNANLYASPFIPYASPGLMFHPAFSQNAPSPPPSNAPSETSEASP